MKVQIDEGLRELIPGYLEGQKENCQTMQTLLNSKDFEAIKKIAHKIKGSGGGYGFSEITNLGAKLETTAQEKDKVSMEKLINQLYLYLTELEVEYVEEE